MKRTATEPRPYVLGTEATERERLFRQGGRGEAESRWLLDQIGVQPGWRAIDLGCGPLGILNLLSERVGPAGEVVGLDREPRLLETARAAIAEHRLTNVRLLEADAMATRLPRSSFDLAHERLLLMVSTEPERVLAEMVDLVRPGGFVALQDNLSGSGLWYPPNPSFERLHELFVTVYRRRGLDPGIGPRLPTLLREAGLVDIRVQVQTSVAYPAGSAAGTMPIFAAAFREDVLAYGLATAAELDRLTDSLHAQFDDPRTLTVNGLRFQAWGRKPLER